MPDALLDVDYVVIGGGSAGCIVAARLSESGRHRVLLVEAGGEPRSPLIRIPAGFGHLLRSPRYNWSYWSQPDAATNNRRIPIPSGRGLGGSGLINGMVYVRGQERDYDDWATSGADGWSWHQVEPYFRRIENFPGDSPGRGHDGPIHLTQVRERFAVADAFLQAAQADGGCVVDDYNLDQRDFGYYQVNQRNGRRWSPYDAYLAPARRRSNLQVMPHTFAESLMFEGVRCTGARLRRGQSRLTVRAAREVVLSAGAFRTPQLLELSGIGDPDVLAGLGVRVRVARPTVGTNYADHYALRMNWRLQGVRTINEMSRGRGLAAGIVRYLTRRTGVLTLGPALCHGFLATDEASTRPDVQLLFMHASYENAAKRVLDREPGMTVGIIQQRPASRGTVHAVSTDVAMAPTIRPGFLTSLVDQQTVVAAMRRVRRLVTHQPLAPMIVREMNPGAQAGDDEALLEWARDTGQTLYHPCGTCRMGSDDGAVVDTRLRVRGVDGLRVVDASVMPSITSGNIHAPVMMVAERAADLILEDELSRAR